MEENNNSWLVTVLVIALVWALFFHKQKYDGQTAEQWFNDYDSEVSLNEDYKNALQDANSNIEEAKSSAWETYDDMGNALDRLDTVSEP